MPSAYWIAMGDLHNSTDRLKIIPGIDRAEGIILTGDLTFAGGAEAARKVLDACQKHNRVVAGQIGNMDKAPVNALFQSLNINLHGQAVQLAPELTLIGAGGSNRTPFNTPSEFSEEEISALLNQALALAGDYENLVLITHAPPLNTKCDRLSNGAHAGSQAVREFIERVQPKLCVCGHIHEARAMDMIGRTPVVNPGAFADGGYVKISLDNGNIMAELMQAG